MSLQGVQPEPPKIPDELRIAIENAQNRYTVLESEIARLTKLNKIERRNVDIALEEQDRLKSESAEMKESIEALRAQKAETIAEISALQKTVSALGSDNNSLKLVVSKAMEDRDNLTAEAVALRAEIATLKASIAQKNKENEDAVSKLTPFVDAVKTLFQQL